MKKYLSLVALMFALCVSCTPQQSKQAEAGDAEIDTTISVIDEDSDALSKANLEKGTGKFLKVNETDEVLTELKFKDGKLNVSYVKGNASNATLSEVFDYSIDGSTIVLSKDGAEKYRLPIVWEVVKPDGTTTCFAFTVDATSLPKFMENGKYWDAMSMTM